ncbi:MAG: hypothetical protein QNI84_08645 [Henriciella sp.]|nr:hypothetical protein [Henriciella sp.]
MKKLTFAIAAAAMIASCQGAPPNETILTQNCLALMENDPEVTGGLLAASGTTADKFCPCYATTILADETKIDLHKEIILKIVETRQANNVGVEEAVDLIEDMIERGEVDSFTSEQLDGTGDDFQDIAGSFEENGVCPVS